MMDEVEQLREGVDVRLVDAVKVKAAMQQMMATEGWKMLVRQLVEQSESRKNKILGALDSADGVYEQEFKKGEIVGILLAVFLPKQILESADEVIKLLSKTMEDQDDAA